MARLVERPAGEVMMPRRASERFTRIEISLFRGRSREAKRRLHRALVEALQPYDVPPEDVKIVLVEVAREDVGLRGGEAACDIDLGYALEI